LFVSHTHFSRSTVTNTLIHVFPLLKDLKRELVSEQVKWEITELNSPTALRRFGAPFKSEFGEVSPLDSELPILRYIFVHHVREFPFLDKAREKEFWQDKLQVVCDLLFLKISAQTDQARCGGTLS
jgi:hypothetical protein